MDNLIFCLNATVPIFAIILLGRLLRGRNFFSKQTLAEIDKLSFKVLLPILLFRAHHRAVQREVLLFLCRRYGGLLFRHLGRSGALSAR